MMYSKESTILADNSRLIVSLTVLLLSKLYYKYYIIIIFNNILNFFFNIYLINPIENNQIDHEHNRSHRQ